MKSLTLIVLIVLQVTVLTSAAKEPCCEGKNEVYNKCGTRCETDCANPGPLRCVKSCKAGCFCKPGYIRDKKDGVCIKNEKCPNKCDKLTEQFTMGVKACQNICGTGVDPACAFTSYMPMTDCFCKDGFIRESKDGKCISVDQCPQSKCNIDTEIYKCGVKSCQYVCGVGVPEICTRARYRCQDDCFCKQDFVRSVNGDCIPVAECPQSKCSIQSEDYRCGVKSCEYVCGVGVPEICTRARYMCEDDCFCKQGFVRNADGDCVPNAECPSLSIVSQTIV